MQDSFDKQRASELLSLFYIVLFTLVCMSVLMFSLSTDDVLPEDFDDLCVL